MLPYAYLKSQHASSKAEILVGIVFMGGPVLPAVVLGDVKILDLEPERSFKPQQETI